jgi:hypothetical protein
MLRRSRVPEPLLACLGFLLVVSLSACSRPDVDLTQAVEPVEVITGWLDKGIVNGQNKLVPTISFKLRSKASETTSNVQVNAVFRVIGDPQELGSRLIRAIDSNGLDPKQATANFVLSSDLGYTSEGSRVQMLQNSQFKDAQVELFAKHAGQQWVKLGEYKISRQLLEQ